MLFPLIEPRCECVGEVRTGVDTAGCLVAEWDSLPRQEQWVVAFAYEGGGLLFDTVDSPRWSLCDFDATRPYTVSVRSRCTNLTRYTWSRWSSDLPGLGIPQQPAARQQPSLAVSPNPTTGAVTVTLPTVPAEGGRLEVYDPSGRQVALLPVGPAARTVALSLAGQPSGVYLLRLSTPDSTATGKVVLK